MHPFRVFSRLLVLGAVALPVAAAIPSVINYQGRLTDGSPTPVPVNGTVNMTFEIWDVQAGGVAGVNRLWLEPASGSTTVQVVNGVFSVQLGASAGGSSVPIPDTLFSSSDTRYLQIIVNGETLAPRQRITATGYANQAAFSLQADTATTAADSQALGGFPPGSWQRALSTPSCPAGQYVTTINQNGTRTCAAATLTPPVTLTAALAAPNGVLEATNTSTGSGLYGENSSGNSNAFGVHGRISTTNPGSFASAVRGENSGVAGSGVGVWGSHAGGGFGVYGTTAAGGRGVYGLAGGSGTGVYGSSTTGNGVFGTSTGTSGVHHGVSGVTASATDASAGVRGEATGATGVIYGVAGYSGSASGAGVYGLGDAGSGSAGVLGEATTSLSDGVRGTGTYTGGSFTGVNPGSYGIRTIANGSSVIQGFSIYSSGGQYVWAGYFFGNVHVNGTLSKAAGSFKIDHPLDPARKYLSHSFVESPDMKNIYDGVVTLDAKGEAEVRMPDWFGALNRDFRYQLTCIGGHAPVYIAEELQDNRFRIAGGRRGLKVSWQVTGIRQDAYAEAHRIPVEEDKPAAEQGSYLHPEVFGQPEEKGVNWAVHPEHMRQEREMRERAKAAAAAADADR